MQDIIKVLPDSIANQIAAGEVIESPSSLLKELVENAIDAKATQITIEVIDSAKTLMRVSDNGVGMSPIDARMAFERHATSKISVVDDLYTLNTMGFRGEALASIAAVSQVELITRPRGESIGHKIIISGSNVEYSGPEMCEEGSSFTVRNLFFNVPARRRFLQSDKRELNAILRAFVRIVLVYPHITFRLYSNQTLLHHLPQNTLLGRIADLYGKKTPKGLTSVNFESPLVGISGFIGLPQYAKRNGSLQFFFVNGRYMKHNYFAKAVESVYQEIIPQGTQPSYFLYLNIDSSRIDVNISPTKTAIKFIDDQAIYKVIISLLRDTIYSVNAVPRIDFDSAPIVDIPIYQPLDKLPPTPKIDIDPTYNPFEEDTTERNVEDLIDQNLNSWSTLSQDFESRSMQWETSITSQESSDLAIKSTEGGQNIYQRSSSSRSSLPFSTGKKSFTTISSSILSPLRRETSFPTEREMFPKVDSEEKEMFDDAKDLFSPNQPSFLFQNKYLVTEVAKDLVLVDIHRASKRVQFESIYQALNQESIPSQSLLFPELIEVSNMMTHNAGDLELLVSQVNTLGFDLSIMGVRSYSIQSVPAIISSEISVEVIRELMEEFIHKHLEEQTIREEFIKSLSTKLSDRSALPYGSVLTSMESTQLLSDLFSCSNSTYTPQGELIMTTLKEGDILKKFR